MDNIEQFSSELGEEILSEVIMLKEKRKLEATAQDMFMALTWLVTSPESLKGREFAKLVLIKAKSGGL